MENMDNIILKWPFVSDGKDISICWLVYFSLHLSWYRTVWYSTDKDTNDPNRATVKSTSHQTFEEFFLWSSAVAIIFPLASSARSQHHFRRQNYATWRTERQPNYGRSFLTAKHQLFGNPSFSSRPQALSISHIQIFLLYHWSAKHQAFRDIHDPH